MCKEPQNSKIVVDNDDLGYQDYIDYRKTLCKSIDSSSSLYIKHIIFIIGGSLVLSLNLISASNEGMDLVYVKN